MDKERFTPSFRRRSDWEAISGLRDSYDEWKNFGRNIPSSSVRKGKAEVCFYRGVIYRRYPDSDDSSARGYWKPENSAKVAGFDYLHRQVYKDFVGEIMEGGHIHHKDKNTQNNSPTNLECMYKTDHYKLHGDEMPEWRKKWLRDRIPVIQQKAQSWHSSPEGIEWHRQHAIEFGFGKYEGEEAECDQCGEIFITRSRHNRFCSNACKSAWRRAAGVDDVEKACVVCGEKFVSNKYAKADHCSRKCAATTRWSQRRLQPNS